MSTRNIKLFEPSLVITAIKQSFVKLNPKLMIKNPVMFTVEIGTAVMLAVIVYQLVTGNTSEGSIAYNTTIFLLIFFNRVICQFRRRISRSKRKAQAESFKTEKKPCKKD